MTRYQRRTTEDPSADYASIRAQAAIDRLEARVEYLEGRVHELDLKAWRAMTDRHLLTSGLVAVAAVLLVTIFVPLFVGN